MKEPLFVDIEEINPRIALEIRYATTNNFMKSALYSSPKAYLRPKVAAKIDAVQKILEAQGLGLKLFDAYRPLSVQKKFWEILPDPRYIADPSVGSCHNRGAAVDVTLIDSLGNELEMPTEFDDFTNKAHLNYNDLPEHVLKNRALLQKVMVDCGFVLFETEWWHFNDADWKTYSVLDIPFEELV